jgi:hypothetical protein
VTPASKWTLVLLLILLFGLSLPSGLFTGQGADAQQLSEMDWFVQGVDGTLPKKK